jgi:hypothetical protein
MKQTADFQRSRTGSDSCRLDTFAEENDVHYSRLGTTILRKNCGHATLASAAVVMDRLEPGRNRVTFHSRSDPLTVKAREREVCDGFPCPALTPDLNTRRAWRSVGCRPARGSGQRVHLHGTAGKRTTRARSRAEHGRPRPHWVTKLKAEPQCISSWTLYHGCTRSPKSFHCSQTNQETTWIFHGNAQLEDWP